MKLEDLKPDLFTGEIKTTVFYETGKTEEASLKPIIEREGLYEQQICIDSVGDIEKVILFFKKDGYNYVDDITFKTKEADEVPVKLGRGRLPKDFPRPSEQELKDFKKYISRFCWKTARTFENFSPHQYITNFPCWKLKEDGKCSGFCTSCKEQRAEFEKWVKFIRKYGERQKMLKTVYTVFCCEERQYWTMGDPMNTTWVLNRALIDDPNRKPKLYWLDRE